MDMDMLEIRRPYQLVGAQVFRQIPLFDASSLIAGDEFSLIRMHANIVHFRGPWLEY